MKYKFDAKKALSLFVFIVVCLAIGWLGSMPTGSSRTTWYATLQKPRLNPPDWVFAPVWTVLYIFMAIAGWRLWNLQIPEKNRLRTLFVVQLILNGVWSYLFFGLRSPLIGLVDIFLLFLCLIVLVKDVQRADSAAGYLLEPYLFWVGFAFYLNFSIWRLNG